MTITQPPDLGVAKAAGLPSHANLLKTRYNLPYEC